MSEFSFTKNTKNLARIESAIAGIRAIIYSPVPTPIKNELAHIEFLLKEQKFRLEDWYKSKEKTDAKEKGSTGPSPTNR